MESDGQKKRRPEHPYELPGRHDRVHDATSLGDAILNLETLQPVGVVIEGLVADEHLQVAVHVHEQENDQDQTGYRHQGLPGDRGPQRSLMDS